MQRRSIGGSLKAALLITLTLATFGGAGFWFLNAASLASDQALPTFVAPVSTLPPTSEGLAAAPADPLPVAGPTPTATRAPSFLTTWLNSAREFLLAEDLSTSVPATPLPQSVRGYLPLLLQNYESPPRPPEAFALLPPYPTDQWPTAAERPTQSKLGVMTLGTGDPYLMEFIRRAKPPVIKAVGDVGWLPEVKQVSPTTVTIGRLAYDEVHEQREWSGNIDPVQAAQLYLDRHLEQYRLNPGVDYWEGWNEFVPADVSGWGWYGQFEAERACLMQANGLRAAVGGFSTGTPEYSVMAEFVPALEAAHRCGGIFHLHEYGRPLLMCGVKSGEANIIPGAPKVNVPAGPLVLRYRFWYQGYLYPMGLGDLPLVISEAGMDNVQIIDCPAPTPGNASTWKSLSAWWMDQNYGPSGPQAYLNQLAWLDREMQHDPYVLGATIFAAGATDAQNSWYHFDIHDVFIPLAHYLISKPHDAELP